MTGSIDNSGFQSEGRIPSVSVAAVLAGLGLAIMLAADARSGSDIIAIYSTLFVGLAVVVVSSVAWRLDASGARIGRWLMVGSLVGLVWWGSAFLHQPVLLTLLAVPTALASALISPSAAMLTAMGSTGLLLVTVHPIAGGAPIAATALIAIWAMLAVMTATCRHASEIAQEAWQYYEHARDWLDDERSHKLEQAQIRADLADANRQLTRMNMLAQELRQGADEARAAKAQFVANVSHELRTPLNMIIGFSELILQAPGAYGRKIPPALLADLAVIKRNAEHLASLVDDVLDLSQVESGQVALVKEYASLNEIVNRAATSVRPIFDSKKLYLEIEVPDALPSVFCDPTRIREVLLNLLSNAGRFTETGGVHLRAWEDETNVTVAITDTGPGISAEGMAKLFQPFLQLDTSIRRRYRGTGLGLNISKHFIDLHDGRIWAESTVGRGTTFFFQLPMTSPMPAGASFQRGQQPEWEYRQRTRPFMAPQPTVLPRFLVLDPAGALVRLLRRYMHDVEVLPVAGVKEALQESLRVPCQALLVNGHTVSQSLETLHTVGELPDWLPVIVCSVPGVVEASEALGAADYLVKPISMPALLGALDRMDIRQGTVLIVDDEPDAQQLFGRMLLSSGRDYRVLTAQDGEEALAMCREYAPDVMLLDLVLPNVDGFQVLRMKSQDPFLRGIPVILISARDPSGQPIVSNAVAVTRRGGLSTTQVLATIRFLSGTPPEAEQPDGPVLPTDPPG